MILLTDIGKDIDDALALTYAAIAKIPISTIITTSKESIESAKICQNILNNVGIKNIDILSGSTEPLKNRGKIHSNFYKGPFSKGDYTFEKFEPLKIKKDDAIIIGPLTDLAGLMENKKINRALFMGQIKKDHESIYPDMQAYNFRCDPFASEIVFQYQETIPFGFVGKSIAYKVPLTKDDFRSFKKTGNPVGEFLYDHAISSFNKFKKDIPDLYERIYKNTNAICYAYDPLTMLAIKSPEFFTFEKFGPHRIAVDIDALKAKDAFISTVVNGLS